MIPGEKLHNLEKTRMQNEGEVYLTWDCESTDVCLVVWLSGKLSVVYNLRVAGRKQGCRGLLSWTKHKSPNKGEVGPLGRWAEDKYSDTGDKPSPKQLIGDVGHRHTPIKYFHRRSVNEGKLRNLTLDTRIMAGRKYL